MFLVLMPLTPITHGGYCLRAFLEIRHRSRKVHSWLWEWTGPAASPVPNDDWNDDDYPPDEQPRSPPPEPPGWP